MTLEYAVVILTVTAIIGSYIQYKLGFGNGYEEGFQNGLDAGMLSKKVILFYKKSEEESK